jgi:hypothetical protein
MTSQPNQFEPSKVVALQQLLGLSTRQTTSFTLVNDPLHPLGVDAVELLNLKTNPSIVILTGRSHTSTIIDVNVTETKNDTNYQYCYDLLKYLITKCNPHMILVLREKLYNPKLKSFFIDNFVYYNYNDHLKLFKNIIMRQELMMKCGCVTGPILLFIDNLSLDDKTIFQDIYFQKILQEGRHYNIILIVTMKYGNKNMLVKYFDYII